MALTVYNPDGTPVGSSSAGINQLTGAVTAGPGSGSQVTILDVVYRTTSLVFGADGAGSVLATGPFYDLQIPFDCTIVAVTLLADQVGDIEIDIWKIAFGSFPPTITNSIVASDPPTLSSSDSSQDTTLTAWILSISANDTLRFTINSVSTITRIDGQLTVVRT